ncbi:MAG TPA: alcohol dehydrogenase catalytic domain-containing protein [Acidobacteriaceae bacterium]|nr:alcohol dehydrogenase catalytic domain-containing protein [Acidobacteriaceae bacterium]
MSAQTATGMMLAGVLHGKEDLRMEQLPMPSAAEGEMIVRVAAALTCGTDLKVYRRGYHAMMLKPPILFGHEVAGMVVETGRGVTKFKVGDRVVPINSAPCDQCFYCLHGQHNLCEDLLFNNGAYAEYIRIPARIVTKNTYAVPDSLALEQAALTEPLACVVHGFNDTGAQSGDTMAVIGAGPIGLMFMHLAKIRGLRVIAVVKRDDQVAAARRFGAAEVIQIASGPETMQQAVAQVRGLTGNSRGADCVIEAVATPPTWEAAVAMVRKGGTVNFFGGPPSGTSVALDTNRLHYGDLTLRASFHHTPAACRAALALISSGRFNAAGFITGSASLADLPGLFASMTTRSADNRGGIKTVVLPPPVASARSAA